MGHAKLPISSAGLALALSSVCVHQRPGTARSPRYFPGAPISLKPPECLTGSASYSLLAWQGRAVVSSSNRRYSLGLVQALRAILENVEKLLSWSRVREWEGGYVKRVQRKQLNFDIYFQRTKRLGGRHLKSPRPTNKPYLLEITDNFEIHSFKVITVCGSRYKCPSLQPWLFKASVLYSHSPCTFFDISSPYSLSSTLCCTKACRIPAEMRSKTEVGSHFQLGCIRIVVWIPRVLRWCSSSPCLLQLAEFKPNQTGRPEWAEPHKQIFTIFVIFLIKIK